eukprot:1693409-Alexandrium_andersonii.AAC.1
MGSDAHAWRVLQNVLRVGRTWRLNPLPFPEWSLCPPHIPRAMQCGDTPSGLSARALAEGWRLPRLLFVARDAPPTPTF